MIILKDLNSEDCSRVLLECFRYEESTGKLFWNQDRPLIHFISGMGKRLWFARSSGCEVGYLNDKEYLCVHVLGNRFRVHRIIADICGLISLNSQAIIDHIDGDTKNNKIDNLRTVSHKVNLQNKKKYKNNKSGVAGVELCDGPRKYRARASKTFNGKQERIELGYFTDISDAAKALSDWRVKEGGYTERHGK